MATDEAEQRPVGEAAEKVTELEKQPDNKASDDNAESSFKDQPIDLKKSAVENETPEEVKDTGDQPTTGNEFDKVIELMKANKLDDAADKLRELLTKTPDDHILLHNLGAILTEQCKWTEAEEIFQKAFELQRKDKKLNEATMFGLATVLTEQATQQKLMQAEALFRDVLVQATSGEEHDFWMSYRAFISLGENLGAQKRWSDAVEVYKHAYELGVKMYGEENDRNKHLKEVMARSQKLARMQKWMWVGKTLAIPVIGAWMWHKYGLIFTGMWSATTNSTAHL
jgi:predicted Zn-dependent protease